MQPEFLYHYTSIEALASILKNRTIRFNKLNRVDDVTEGKSHDFDYISEYFFISCWTDLEEESIPFWNMYTPGMKGVRIKLPSSLFNKYGFLTDGIDGLQTTHVYSLIPKHQTFGNNFWIVPTHNNYLWNVQYTSEKDLLKPEIETIEEDKFTVSLNKIGKYKSQSWAFQSEWRYVVKIFPLLDRNSQGYIPSNDLLEESISLVRKGEIIPFNFYDFPVNNEKFEKMEITLGPKCSASEITIVESLINNFNQSAVLRNSHLTGTIR